MGCVRTAKSISLLIGQFRFNSIEIALGHHHVAVEHNEVIALGPLGTIVAALPRTAVRLGKIAQRKAVGILLANSFAGGLAAVFNNQHFKVAVVLMGQALQQFINFVGPVIDRYDE